MYMYVHRLTHLSMYRTKFWCNQKLVVIVHFYHTILSHNSFTFREMRSLLMKCAATSLNSKLIARQKDFFSKMVVDAVSLLDDMLPLNMIGVKKVQGGSLEVITKEDTHHDPIWTCVHVHVHCTNSTCMYGAERKGKYGLFVHWKYNMFNVHVCNRVCQCTYTCIKLYMYLPLNFFTIGFSSSSWCSL